MTRTSLKNSLTKTVAFFTENTHCGGLDAFLIELINHWPHTEQRLVLFCNKGHPGLATITQQTTRPLQIIEHEILSYSLLALRLETFLFLKILRKGFTPLLKYFFIFLNAWQIFKLLRQHQIESLMVVNGGYPAGDTCRSAAIGWFLFGRQKSVFNFHNFATKASPPFWLQEFLIDSLLAKSTTQFISVSQACLDSLTRRRGLKYFKNKKVIYNGIRTLKPNLPASHELRHELNLQNAPVILMMGTYEPRKGHDFLFKAFLSAWQKNPLLHLVVCGFGLEREMNRVKKQRDDFICAPQIHLLNFRKDKEALYSLANVVAVSSEAFESFGLTIIEAFSLNIPVVARATGGVPEVMGADHPHLIAHDDVSNFATHLLKLTTDEATRQQAIKIGETRFKNYFGAKRMTDAYANTLLKNHE